MDSDQKSLIEDDNKLDEKSIPDNYKYPKVKWFLCYFVAFILVIAIIYGFSGIIADILTKGELLKKDIDSSLQYRPVNPFGQRKSPFKFGKKFSILNNK